MQDRRDRPERLALDRIDQAAHPLSALGGKVDVLAAALPALSDVGRGAVLAAVDLGPGEQGIALGLIAHCLRELAESRDQRRIEMGLGEIEADVGDLAGERLDPLRIALKQLFQRGRGERGKLAPHGARITLGHRPSS